MTATCTVMNALFLSLVGHIGFFCDCFAENGFAFEILIILLCIHSYWKVSERTPLLLLKGMNIHVNTSKHITWSKMKEWQDSKIWIMFDFD